MAMLNDTVINGSLVVFDSIYLSERKKNLATLSNNGLIIGDSAWDFTLNNKDIILNAAGITKILSSGNMEFSAGSGSKIHFKTIMGI